MSEHEATLERRIYARLDESLGPINDALDAVTTRLDALDAVTTRLDALAAQYEALAKSVQGVAISAPTSEEFATLRTVVSALEQRSDRHAEINEQDGGILDQCRSNRTSYEALSANFQSFKETADRVFDTFEAQFQTLERRDKQVELQLEGLAADIVESRTRLHALCDEHYALHNSTSEARDALSDRISVLESTRDNGLRISGRPLQPEDMVDWRKVAAQALRDNFDPRNAINPVRDFGPSAFESADSYEVDGHPATRAEYEAAENDAKAPHTTRHVHRPFSDGVSLHSTAHPGSNQLSPESLEEIEIEIPDIGWAVQKLKAGRDVRRRGWVNTGTKAYIGARLGLRIYNPATGTDAEYAVPQHELWATDWEIAP